MSAQQEAEGAVLEAEACARSQEMTSKVKARLGLAPEAIIPSFLYHSDDNPL